MKSCCKSQKLIAYGRNFDYIYFFNNKDWILSNPCLDLNFIYGELFNIQCLSCFKIWKDKINPSLKNKTNHSEITLDLDHTLFFTEISSQRNEDSDFSFKDHELNFHYSIFKRPGLSRFINFLVKNYKKINFYTSALDWYAEKLINSLNIPKKSIGFVKTRKDTLLERCISFDKEYMKIIDNSLIIEDKPLVIKGFNNTVIRVSPYYGDKNDKELSRITKFLKKGFVNIKKPNSISGEVNLYPNNIKFLFKKIPYSLIEKVNSLQFFNNNERNHFHFVKDKGYFDLYSNLSYSEYLEIYNLFKKHTKSKPISFNRFEKIKEDSFNNNF